MAPVGLGFSEVHSQTFTGSVPAVCTPRLGLPDLHRAVSQLSAPLGWVLLLGWRCFVHKSLT